MDKKMKKNKRGEKFSATFVISIVVVTVILLSLSNIDISGFKDKLSKKDFQRIYKEVMGIYTKLIN